MKHKVNTKVFHAAFVLVYALTTGYCYFYHYCVKFDSIWMKPASKDKVSIGFYFGETGNQPYLLLLWCVSPLWMICTPSNGNPHSLIMVAHRSLTRTPSPSFYSAPEWLYYAIVGALLMFGHLTFSDWLQVLRSTSPLINKKFISLPRAMSHPTPSPLKYTGFFPGPGSELMTLRLVVSCYF